MAKKINLKKPNPGPAELPKFSTAIRRRPIVGGPQEMPGPTIASRTVNVLVGELNVMRARLSNLETQMLQLNLGGVHGIVGGPNELPVPEIDTGAGNITIPRRGPNPAELPIELSRAANALQVEISALQARLSVLKQSVGATQQG